tara:strand:+ start:197 stop:424 length:228 start_codon:yes stop_codon:yes gene_type:complete
VSVRTYLGQVSKSTDKINIGKDNEITNGLTFKNKSILEKITKEKKNKIIFIIIKINCQLSPKKYLVNEIKITGIV